MAPQSIARIRKFNRPLLKRVKQQYRSKWVHCELSEIVKYAKEERDALVKSGQITEDELETLCAHSLSKEWASKWRMAHQDHFEQTQGAKQMLGLEEPLPEHSLLVQVKYIDEFNKASIISAIQKDHNIRLHFSDYSAETSAMTSIMKAIMSAKTLEYLSLHKPWKGPVSIEEINSLTNLKVLVLWNCKLSDKEVVLLSNGLLRNQESRLKELILTRNGIGPVGAGSIADAMASQEGPNIECLSLDHNVIGSVDAGLFEKLVYMINSYVSLKRLHLEGNGFGNSICEVFEKVESSSIHDLMLADNEIDDKGISIFGDFLERSKLLEFLSLAGNNITSKGYNVLAENILRRRSKGMRLNSDDIPRLNLAVDMEPQDEECLVQLKTVKKQFLTLVSGFKFHADTDNPPPTMDENILDPMLDEPYLTNP